MEFKIKLILLLGMMSINLYATSYPLEGKVFTNLADAFTLKNETNSSDFFVLPDDQILLVPNSEASNYTFYGPNRVYFKSVSSKAGTVEQGTVFSLSKEEFEQQISQKQYGNWVKTQFETAQNEVLSIEVKTRHLYQISKEDTQIAITLREIEEKSFLTPNERFYLEEGSLGYNLVIPPHSGRYRVDNPQQLEQLFANGHIQQLGAVEFEDPLTSLPTNSQASARETSPPTTAQTNPIDETAYMSQPTPKGSVETVIQAQNEIIQTFDLPPNGCEDFEAKLNSNYQTCTASNDYLQNDLKRLLMPEDLNSSPAEKFCILAGLKSGVTFKTAQCQGENLINSDNEACLSKEYVSFIHKELQQMSQCFTNLSIKEMLPLVNAESKFHHNAYNLNKDGSLNASGLLQATQILIESQKEGFIHGNGYQMEYDSSPSYCHSIREEIRTSPLPETRNVCQRTNLPNGFRKNLYLTYANFSFYKKEAQETLDHLSESYFRGNELFNSEEKEKVLINITRLMHNRGVGKIKNRLRSFFYDLFHGSYGQAPSQSLQVGQSTVQVRHGNARIHSLWGRPNFKAPLSNEELLEYFSSYIFWEGKSSRGSNGQQKNPESNALDDEGGTYLHKLACEQEVLTRRAQDLAQNQHVKCGYPATNSSRIEKTQVEVGWYYNVCKQENSSQISQRRCSAKNPFNAKNANGQRRLSNQNIEAYTQRERYLKLCDRETLRGLAVRPLKEFYLPSQEN